MYRHVRPEPGAVVTSLAESQKMKVYSEHGSVRDDCTSHPTTPGTGARYDSADNKSECSMVLPAEKAAKYLADLKEVVARHEGADNVPLQVLDSLTGKLAWVARLSRWGKAFLGEAYTALGRFSSVPGHARRSRRAPVSREFWDADMPF